MRKFISALAFGALLIPDYGFTLGMGDIEVNSALNQQLNARIELLSSVPEDADTLIVKLASREEFARAGLDRPYSLTSLRFKSVVVNGQLYIDVTTPKPVREPFLNFVIEVDWPKGHLLREYTILLDPPVFMGQQDTSSARPAAAQASTAAPAPVQSTTDSARPAASGGFRPAASAAPVAAPVTQAPVQATPAANQPEASQPEAVAPVPVQQQASYSSQSGGYRVQAGDTAWSLADGLRPDQSVSVQQMMLAMLRTNPEIFINGNVNGLKKGYILRIPDRSEITAVNQEEARALVQEQNALWREYQQAQSVDQPASALDTEAAEDESEYGSGIKSSDDARLSIVSAGSGAGAGESKDPTEMSPEELREQLALAREELETARVENEGLEGDLGSLEDKVEKMQSLLQIEDESMAEIQDVAEGEEAIATEDEAMVEEAGDEEAALAALDELTGETEAAEETDEIVSEEEVAEGEEVFTDEMAESEEIVVEEEIEVEVVESEPVRMAPREEAGLVASLLGNPLVTGGVALLVLILGAVGYILVKRRRDSAGAAAEATLAADLEQGFGTDLEDVADSIDDAALDDFVTDEEVEDSMAAAEDEAQATDEAEEESFDSEATMILPSTEDTVVTQAAGAAAEEEEEERDDVIAEADVYLAYGIYQQAEELLENALKDNPDKDNYRVKLAETYFAGKNAEGLTKLGTEMKARLSGEDTKAWQKVAAMGKELCPEEAVFGEAGEVADLDIDELMPKVPEPMDFDLGDDAGGDVPDLDLDFGAEDDTAAAAVNVDETIAIPDPGQTAVIPPAEPEADAGELEFDIGEAEAVEGTPAATEDEFSLDIEASELDIQEEATPVEEEDSVEIDSSELDFDMGLDDEAPAAEESADADMDFSMDTEASPAEAAPAADASGEVDLSDLGDVDEINTKLDLAKAYIDMGDHEGARDILDEVVAGGNDEQKKEATELLGQMS